MELEVIEDESGKWIWPYFLVVDAATGEEVAGPFETEAGAIRAMDDLLFGNIQ